MTSKLLDSLASQVVLTIKSAIAPMQSRLDILEQERKDTAPLHERIALLEYRLAKTEELQAKSAEDQELKVSVADIAIAIRNKAAALFEGQAA